ncbi:outer membrane protein [Prosthecomicrobium sp. N25]|uniref:outer membrane protein n=1 Tax=Prosthecomicrobium sp. N25 TaxID=3129254 RepID=UPI003076B2C7
MLKTRLLAAVAALALSAGAASAADLYRAAPVPAPVAPTLIPAFVWTGGFVGLHAGYGWADINGRKGTKDATADGFLAGVHGGFNWQYNMLVIGADTNWSWTDITSTRKARKVDMNWTGDLRGRVGFAFDRFHLYAAGGIAFADINPRSNGKKGKGDSQTETGWTAGLGAEYAITNNFVMGAEWKYQDYGRIKNVDVTANIVLLKASWKF